MSSITVQNADIVFRDNLEVTRQMIIEGASGDVPEKHCCGRSFTIKAVYVGPEVIENRILATRTFQIPVWKRTCMQPVNIRIVNYLIFPIIVSGVMLLLGGSISKTPIILYTGIALFTTGAVCYLATRKIHTIASNFRAKMRSELNEELLEEAKRAAEARITVARKDRDSGSSYVRVPLLE